MAVIHENISENGAEVRNGCREKIELLRSRVSWLSGRDEVLMKMYLEKEVNFSRIARLTGESRVNVSRRIRKIARRLLEGEYVRCLEHRERFTERELEIAKEHFLWGVAAREVAKRHGLSYYEVRETVRKIRWMVRGI
jgi:predicted DNA-binding protein YlxM (UPF0122 family)